MRRVLRSLHKGRRVKVEVKKREGSLRRLDNIHQRSKENSRIKREINIIKLG
jgi:hypothetical protein